MFFTLSLWFLGSLFSISQIGAHPEFALGLAVLGGIAFGVDAYLEYRKETLKLDTGKIANRSVSIVARYGWIIDVAATLLLIIRNPWTALGGILVVISWSLRYWANGRVIPSTPLNVPILALIVMIPPSLWASADARQNLGPIAQIVAGINIFCVMVERFKTDQDLRRAVMAVLLFGTVAAMIALLGVDWIKTKQFALPQLYDRIPHVLPFSIHPNSLAGALVPILALATAIFLYDPLEWLALKTRRYGRMVLGLGLATMLITILMTQSRGGIVAMFAAGLLFVAFKSRRTTTLLGAVGVTTSAFVLSRIDLFRVLDFFSTDAVGNLAGREELWSRAVYIMQDVPYTGIGLGLFSRAVPAMYPLFLVRPEAEIAHAHNLYLQVGVDLGVPGLVAFLAMMVVGLVTVWHKFRIAYQRGRTEGGAISLGLFGGLIAIMLHGLVDSPMWDYNPEVLIWVFLGMIAVADQVLPD